MPLDAITLSSSLSEIAFANLHDVFKHIDHSPSAAQWTAIRDLLDCLEKAADGRLEPAVYVSAIPAGTGKTTAIVEFAKALMDDPQRASVGMMVTCSRIEEVKGVADKLSKWHDRLCVIVGQDNPEVLAMGDHEAANAAQVVICTQEALKRTLKMVSSFDEATRFHYRGQRRAVISWDEAFAFSRSVVLDPNKAPRLSEVLADHCGAAQDALLAWTMAVKKLPEGLCEVPDFVGLGVDFPTLEEAVADDEDSMAIVKALAVMSGGSGYLKKDNRGKGGLLHHTPEIPPSLMPVIVTDASAALGVHHDSYAYMARTRPVRWLAEAQKTYGNLTLRIVPTAASRSVYRDTQKPRGRDLIDMAVHYIRRVAPQRVLVIGYRNRFQMKGVRETTIKAAIKARLTADEWEKVHYLTWGRHTATNEHSEVRHVVLMGLNYLPSVAVHAAAGAMLDLTMRSSDPSDHPSKHEVVEMRRGMLRDSTLQAILRGNARKGVNGDCGEMVAVIPQTRQLGLSENDYRGMFPCAAIQHDAALLPAKPAKKAKPLRGNLLKLCKILNAHRAAGETEIATPDLVAQMGMDRSNFRNLTKRPEWLAWLTANGWEACNMTGRTTGIRGRVA